MESEDRSFLDYRERPGRDSLIALLRAHQSTVYIICFQVLRNPHDAEDAAQEVLLEVIRGADRIREPRAFKRWLCRAALHTALDQFRRRARRSRHEEERAVMTHDTPDRAVDAIHEALARLGDEDRCLLVEKYFEQATLEQLAARVGVSTAAVWKRIERAKERLKRTLQGVGLAAVVPRVDSMLESAVPVLPAPDLVSSSAVLNAAVARAGSAVMGAKAMTTTVILGSAVLLLLIGATSAFLWVTGRLDFLRSVPSGLRDARKEAPGTSSAAVPDDQASPGPGPTAPSEPRSGDGDLLSRLVRFRLWYDKYKPLQTESTFSLEDDTEPVKAELQGVRELILKQPAVFLAWLTIPENARCINDLVAATISEVPEPEDDSVQSFKNFPRELTDGLLGLLQTATPVVREAILHFAHTLRDAPDSWRARYVSMLADDNTELSDLAVRLLLTTGKTTLGEVHAVIGLAEQPQNAARAPSLMWQLARNSDPEVRDLLLSALESGRIPDGQGETTVAALELWLRQHPSTDEALEERLARILSLAMARATNPHRYSMIVQISLNLALPQAQGLLSQAAREAPTLKLRNAADAALQRAKTPGASPRVLQDAWIAEIRKK